MAVKKAIKSSKKTTKKTATKKVVSKKAPVKKKVVKKVQVKKSTSKTIKKAKTNTVANNKSKIAPYKPKKNEKYMSAAMKRHFIAVLLLWKEHLLDEMRKTFDHLKAKGETFADPVDRASQEEEFAFELRTRDRERKLINKISTSIEKIKQDDYGWCDACGDEIGVKRLEARPIASLSLDAQEKHERMEKVHRDE